MAIVQKITKPLRVDCRIFFSIQNKRDIAFSINNKNITRMNVDGAILVLENTRKLKPVRFPTKCGG